MTAAVSGARPRWGLRWRWALLVVVALAVVGLLAGMGLGNDVVYYKTPTELVKDPGMHGKRVRLGGLVERGSVRRGAGTVSFVLTDGVTDVHVVNRGTPAGIFRAGQGALVEGTWSTSGAFHSDQVLVKHSNTYRGTSGKPYTPPTFASSGKGGR